MSTSSRFAEAIAADISASRRPARPQISPGSRVIPPFVAINGRSPEYVRTASATNCSLCPKCSASGA